MIELTGFHRSRITSLAFSPEGRCLATAASGIGLWNSESGVFDHEIATGDSMVPKDLAFLPDGSLLYVSTQLRRIQDGRSELLFDRLRGGATLALPPGDYEVSIAGSDNVTRLKLKPFAVTSWGTDYTTGGVAYSPDGRVLATGHYRHNRHPSRPYFYQVLLRELATGEVVKTMQGCTNGVRRLAFSPDGRWLVGAAGMSLHVWRVGTGERVFVRDVGKLHFQSIAFTPDGRYLLTASNDATVRVWDGDKFEQFATFDWQIGKLTALAVAPDGLRAAVGGGTGDVVIWDLDW